VSRDRTVLVTGASRGIGRAIAVEFAASGAKVAVNYRSNSEAAAGVVGGIRRSGGRAMMVQADVSDPAQIGAMIAAIVGEFGPVEILVNNAAVLYPGDLDDFDASQFAEMCRVNIDGLLHLINAVAPQMIDKRFGRIVNLTSIAAYGTTFANNTFYAATKAAVITLTRGFALQLGRYGVTVNAVAPGFVMTDMALRSQVQDEMDTVLKRVSGLAMVRRVGRPEDIAHAVRFLASNEAGFITAQVITVDGGRTDYLAHP
jgi:3-oxoacyl-[acyl-carrier protein] reductase